MRKLFLGFTLLFALEARAGDPGGAPDELKKLGEILTVTAVAGMVIFGIGVISIIDSGDLETADFVGAEKQYFYDIESNSIVFTENSNLENFEILLSRDTEINFSSTQYFDNNLFKSDELYVGFKYRF
jgi:hypothetical protein